MRAVSTLTANTAAEIWRSRRRRIAAAGAAWLLLAGSAQQPLAAWADDPSAHPLRPYTATYKTSARGLSLTLERSLRMDDKGDCRLTSEGSLLVAGISEISVFAVEGEQVVPKSYVYQLSGPVSRRREVHFDPGSDVIRSLYKKEWYELPKGEGKTDGQEIEGLRNAKQDARLASMPQDRRTDI